MNEYVIKKGVPIPDGWPAKKTQKYPFRHLEVGDSFAVPKADRYRACAAGSNHAARFNKKFISRSEGKNVRIWRIR